MEDRPLLLHEHVAAAAHTRRDRVALVFGERSITYGELMSESDELASAMRAAGVTRGDRVVVMAGNRPEYLVAALAIWQAGGIVCTVYRSFQSDELAYVVANARPRLALVEYDRASDVRAVADRSSEPFDVWPIDGSGIRVPAHDGAPEPAAALRPSDPAVLCYTSGTTAHPKPVLQSHGALTGGVRLYERLWHIDEDDKVLVSQPLAWLCGLISLSVMTLGAGGTVVLQPRFSPGAVFDAIERLGATVLPGVTTMFVKLVAYAAALGREPDCSTLRFCTSSGEPRNEPAFAAWQRLSGCPVYDVYGASECFPVATYDPVADPQPRPGSAGRLVPGAELRLVAEDGSEAGPGEVGEGYTRGNALMLGYWGEPELTRGAIDAEGWYRTSDFLRVDDDGYLYVMGRVSDMIVRGGANISPVEIEAVLAEHPDIDHAAVVGLPDPEYGQRIAAAVTLAPGARLSEEAMRALCAARLAPYKVPAEIRAVGELPRNVVGKVQRREVAAMLDRAPLRD